MTTHTPGPWTYQAYAGDHDFGVYPESSGQDVALVRDFNEANARLIAAAPELLEALKATMRTLRLHHGNDCMCRECKDARDAIAKATN